MPGLSGVWQVGNLLVRPVGMRADDYEDAVTGCWVPLTELPERAALVMKEPARPEDLLPAGADRSAILARAKRQRQGIHSDLLRALRDHGQQHQQELTELLDEVVPLHCRGKLFADTPVHVFHADGNGDYQLVAIVTLPRTQPIDNLANIHAAISATNQRDEHWALSIPSEPVLRVEPMGLAEPSGQRIAGTRPTQAGDLMILHGAIPYAVTEHGPIEINGLNTQELGFNSGILKTALARSNMTNVAPLHVLAAQLATAFSTLAATVGASPEKAICLLTEYLTHRFFPPAAVTTLMRESYDLDDAPTTQRALAYARLLIDELALRNGMTPLIPKLHEWATAIAISGHREP